MDTRRYVTTERWTHGQCQASCHLREGVEFKTERERDVTRA